MVGIWWKEFSGENDTVSGLLCLGKIHQSRQGTVFQVLSLMADCLRPGDR